MTLPSGISAHHVFFCSVLACGLAYSIKTDANIEVSKFFEVGATATDNPELLDGDTSVELVFSVKPAVELKYAGNRFGAVARGEVEYLRFADAEDEIIDPRLSAKLDGTLIDNLLFLESSLTVSRTSPAGGFLRLSDEGNNTAATFETTTFLDKSFGQAADLYVAHTLSTFVDTESGALDSTRNVTSFNLERNPQNGGFLWGVGGSYSQDNSELNEFQNSSLYGKIGTTLSQTLLTELTVGVESRELESDDLIDLETENAVNNSRENTEVWQLDFTWTPSEFTSLTAGYGERFFGRGPRFEFEHRVRTSSIFASFTRDITRQTASLDGISTLTNNTNQTITDTDSISITDGNLSNPLDEPFIDNQFRLAYKRAGRRSDFIVDAVYSEQERLDSSQTIDTWLARLAFDRRLSNFLSLRLQYEYQLSKSPELSTLNFSENRFAVKFIYHFDGVSEFDDNDLEIE